MVWDLSEFRKNLKINKYQLDEEIVQQSENYFSVAEQYANVVSLRDEAYEKLKQVDADLYLDIRDRLAHSGEKATEATVNSLVMVDEEHVKQYEVYLEHKRQSETLQALKDAFSQRSFMLRDLAQLYISGYYMDGAVVGAETGARDQRYQRNREIIKERLKDKHDGQKVVSTVEATDNG